MSICSDGWGIHVEVCGLGWDWVELKKGVGRGVERAIHTSFPLSIRPTTLQANSFSNTSYSNSTIPKRAIVFATKSFNMFWNSFYRPLPLWPGPGTKSYGQFVVSSFSCGKSGRVRPFCKICALWQSGGIGRRHFYKHFSLLSDALAVVVVCDVHVT